MTASEWTNYLLLALMLGTAGQLMRVAVGMKKLHDKNSLEGQTTHFDKKKFWISIMLGALAGMITALLTWKSGSQLFERDFLLTLVVAGYAGSDLMEGLIERVIKTQPTST